MTIITEHGRNRAPRARDWEFESVFLQQLGKPARRASLRRLQKFEENGTDCR